MNTISLPGSAARGPHFVPNLADVTAQEWHARLYVALPSANMPPGVLGIRRFVATQPDVEQPPLIDDVVCLHLGGAKRVHRDHGGCSTVHDVPMGSLTTMPRHQRNRWRTIGPVDFVHITLSPGLLDQIAMEEFGEDPATVGLHDEVGFCNPLLEALARELAAAVENPLSPGRLYAESLLVAFAIALLRAKSRLARFVSAGRPLFQGGLAGWRLRRVTDYIETRLGEDIGLGDLAALSGLSRAQFFRAFRQTTGTSPARYLARQRVARAERLIASDELSLAEIASAAGFKSRNAFTAAFRRETGTTPATYRSLAR